MNPALERDLDAWLGAGLLNAEQVAGIRRFEARRAEDKRRGRPAKAIALLGALTLVSGVGSIIAYNWDDLGDAVKLAGMGVLLAASAVSVHWIGQRHTAPNNTESAALDVTLVLYSGLTLAGLALVSQIYHRDGPLWQLLAVWSLLVAPALWRSSTRFATTFWYTGLWITLLSSFDDLEDVLSSWALLQRSAGEAAVMLLWGTGAIFFARSMKSPVPARTILGKWLLQLHLLFLAVVGSFAWWHGGDAHPELWAVGAASAAAVVSALPAEVRALGWGERRHVAWLFGLGGVLAVLPLGLRVDSGVLAFFSFAGFFCLAWFFAERHGSTGATRLAVAALGLRIVAASFELFESLLVTGSTLMALGALALFFTRKNLLDGDTT